MIALSSIPSSTCSRVRRTRALIEQHFAGEGNIAGERQMRAHLAQCEGCRETYERYLLLADLDPRLPNAKERIARGLGLQPRRSAILARPQIWALAAAAASVLVLMYLGVDSARPATVGFQARGATAGGESALLVYRVGDSGAPALIDGVIAPSDEVAFAYRNPSGKKRLMIFALDTLGKVYWYHPAWRDPRQDPAALPIRTAPGTHELTEAIQHRLTGKTVAIVALFSDATLHVKQIEKLLGPRGDLNALRRLPDTTLELQKVSLAGGSAR